jgi:hypothetical protein
MVCLDATQLVVLPSILVVDGTSVVLASFEHSHAINDSQECSLERRIWIDTVDSLPHTIIYPLIACFLPSFLPILCLDIGDCAARFDFAHARRTAIARSRR